MLFLLFPLFRSLDYFLTKEFKGHFSKAIEDTFEVEPCTMDPPPVTVYHFYEARRWIAKRISQIKAKSSSSQSMDIFDVDYTKKSLDYLFDKSFTWYSRTSSLPPQKSNFDEWPESIRLLIKLSSFITYRPINRIIFVLYQLDRYVSRI